MAVTHSHESGEDRPCLEQQASEYRKSETCVDHEWGNDKKKRLLRAIMEEKREQRENQPFNKFPPQWA